MDKFLTIRKTKEVVHPLAVKLLAHRLVCLHGAPGSGKSWAVRDAFPKYIELDFDTLRSRQSTVTFLERVADTDLPIIVDEWEIVNEFIGAGEIQGPLNKSTTVIISNAPLEREEFEFVNIEWKTPDLIPIGKKFSSDLEKIRACAEKCQGNLHIFLSSINFDDCGNRDIFESPKKFIYSLLCKGGTNQVGSHMASHVHEPGYVWGVVQENYVDVPDKPMEFYADIAHSMSTAGIFDSDIYNGHWELMPFFNLHACLLPASLIEHSLDAEALRPGSMWTKYQNFCMRNKKLKTIYKKNLEYNISIDSLMLIRDYCIHGDSTILKDYKFDKADLDVLNHLSIIRKIKVKTLSSLKKSLVL